MKIVAAQPLKKQILEVHDEGVTYTETSGFGMGETSRFSFDQIDAVVKSATEPLLSIQVGTTTVKLTFKKDNETHRAVIARIVDGARESVGSPGRSDPAPA
jgi:hypothetical protein